MAVVPKEIRLFAEGRVRDDKSRKAKQPHYSANALYNTENNTITIKAGSQCARWGEECYKQAAEVKTSRIEAKDYIDDKGKFIKDYVIQPEYARYTKLTKAYRLINSSSSGAGEWGYIDHAGVPHNSGLTDYLRELGVLKEKQYVPPLERVEVTKIEEDNIKTIRQDSATRADKIETNILKPYLGKNTIFYGVPGCGKSYKVKELLGADGEGSKVPEAQCKRVLFHPEYSYSDFVGQVMPQTEGERIEYKFAPGPFVEILKDAYDHPRKEYFLIIEEINRGNAPAIFGDLFQLLDRRPKKSGEEDGAKPGESEYGIYNRDILGVLNEGREEPLKEVKIPANLTLFATMNTCDQNVFTLDTAFKRRWRMQRIKNMVYADKEPFVCVIGQSGGKIGERGIIWKEFAEAVNKDILLNCNDGTAAEDKLLGAYFVNEEEIADAQVFAEKVLMYLREDVARYDKSQLFDAKYPTLDAVIYGFVRGENVFSPACGNIKALYDRVPDTATPSEEE